MLTAGPPVQEECEELGKPSGGYERVTAKGTRPTRRRQREPGGAGWQTGAAPQQLSSCRAATSAVGAGSSWLGQAIETGKELWLRVLSWDIHKTSEPGGLCSRLLPSFTVFKAQL